MLTLRFSCCFFSVMAPVKPPFFMRDSCHRWFFRIFCCFSISPLCLVFCILGTVERVNPFEADD